MGKTHKKSVKKKISYNRMGMLAIAMVVCILLAGLVYESRTLQNRIAIYDARAEELEESIQAEKDRTEEIDELKEYMQTDEFAEEVARDKLGLVKDNEIVFKESQEGQ